MFVFCFKMVPKMCSDTLKVTGCDQKEICSQKCRLKEEAVGPLICVCGHAFPHSLSERPNRQRIQPYACTHVCVCTGHLEKKVHSVSHKHSLQAFEEGSHPCRGDSVRMEVWKQFGQVLPNARAIWCVWSNC